LLTNGIKYNRVGGTLTITCTPDRPDRLRLNVIDTGPGLDPEKTQRLFQPFERLGAEHTATEGTGLGLALSKGLAEAMGGRLGVISEVGQGSTFWLELVQTSRPEFDPAHDRTPAPLPDRATVAGRVLYIEDNGANFQLMKHICQLRPLISLAGAKQGAVGLALARTFRPDLILLDLRLPDMSGNEVLRRLCEDERTSHIPIAVISAEAAPAEIHRLQKAGAAAYITKPLDIRRVLQLFDTVLGGDLIPQ
jgi:CheY-like chemotaxis protein